MTLGNKVSGLSAIPPLSPFPSTEKKRRKKPTIPYRPALQLLGSNALKLFLLRPLKPVEGNGDSRESGGERTSDKGGRGNGGGGA